MTNLIQDRIQMQNDLINAIQQDSRSKSRTILLRLALTLAPSLIVLVVTSILVNALRAWVDQQFNDSFLNTTTQLSTLVVWLGLAWGVGKAAERRFGGLRLLRGLFKVAADVRQVEAAITLAQAQAIINEDELTAIDGLAQRAWDNYQRFLQQAGLAEDKHD